jgi:hypothetical protein
MPPELTQADAGVSAGDTPPGARLAQEDEGAMERLVSMGFDKGDAEQAFLECGKDEMRAANRLMDGICGDDGGSVEDAPAAPTPTPAPSAPGWTCTTCTFVNEDSTAAVCAVCGADRPAASAAAAEAGKAAEAALREPVRAAADWRADKAAAVAARRAAAPEEVRVVLCGMVGGEAELRRVSPAATAWLVEAHAAAHDDPATKRLARLVLGVRYFAENIDKLGAEGGTDTSWDDYKAGLRQRLQALGAPLAEQYEAEGLHAVLGGYEVQEHALVAAERGRCAAAGTAYELRSDIPGVVPVPVAWTVGADADPSARQHYERVFIHMLKMIAIALNEQFHEAMRDLLGPYAVAGKGLTQQKGGQWYICAEKGVARMECKRLSDHRDLDGCRPAANIDVLRVLGVCDTPVKLLDAMQAVKVQNDGFGRVKNGFATDDEKAAAGFHLRVMMANFIKDFGCTYAELAQRPGVAAKWQEHVEESVPEGCAPRGRWRAEAAEAHAVLTGGEFAPKPVLFICEAQMMLQQTYDIRSHMHEVRAILRTPLQLAPSPIAGCRFITGCRCG